MPYTGTQTTVGLQAIAGTETTQAHALGTITKAKDPLYGEGEFIYLKGLAATAVGDAVIYNAYTGVTTRLVAGGKGALAWAMSANLAGSFGWYQISGAVVANVAAGFTAAADAYATATAGVIAVAVVAGDLIAGAVGSTAIGTPISTQAVLTVSRPSIT